jgi:putative membrane protein
MRNRSTTRFLLGLLCWVTVTGSALAHPSAEHDESLRPHNWSELWRAWTLEPAIIIPLLLTAWLYLRGVRLLWRQGGRGHGVRGWEAGCFMAGWLTLTLALVSPVHAWGDVLFSVHMSQHELLMLVAAPLLVLGKPVVASLKGLPAPWTKALIRCTKPGWVQQSWRALTNPFVAWLIHAVVLWVWHIPFLFHAALESEFVHALQHLAFLFSALLFWWAVLEGRQKSLGYGVAVLYMFTTAVHSGFLGALITLASSIWYPDYQGRTESWGLSALEDQQLGGLIMWVPACTVYIIAALALFAAWLSSSEARVRRREMVAAMSEQEEATP